MAPTPTHSSSRRVTWRRCLLALIVAVFPLAGVSVANAAEDAPQQAWLVQPAGKHGGADERAYFSHDVDPGDWIEDTVAIVNHAEEPLTLSLYGTDAFTNVDSGAFGLLPGADAPGDAGSWVHLAEDEVTVPARSRMEVPFGIRIPKNATPGDHAGGIVTSFLTKNTDGSGLDFDARIAVRLYLNVSGELAPNLLVRDLETDYDLAAHQTGGTTTVSYTVFNPGNLRLGGEETVTVSGPFGHAKKKQTSVIDEVLPGGQVRRTVEFTGVPPLGWLDVNVAVAPTDIGERLEGRTLPTATVSDRLMAVSWVLVAAFLILGIGTTLLVRARRRRWKALQAELETARAEREAVSVDS